MIGRFHDKQAGIQHPPAHPRIAGARRGLALRRLNLRPKKRGGLIGHWELVIGHSVIRHRRTSSDLSATTVESDGDPSPLDDHGNGALTLGVLKHLLHPRRVLGHVDVLEGNLSLAVILPGGKGVGSGVLAED